jgi:hypothetical protein
MRARSPHPDGEAFQIARSSTPFRESVNGSREYVALMISPGPANAGPHGPIRHEPIRHERSSSTPQSEQLKLGTSE